MSLYCATGSVDTDLPPQQLHDLLGHSLGHLGERKRVLVVPPDQSRMNSRAGKLTRRAWEYYGDHVQAVLPALGTHAPMRPEQIARMFGAHAGGALLRPQLANRRRDPRRGSLRIHLPVIGGQAELRVAGASQSAHCAWRLRPHPLDRPRRAS